MQFVDACYNTMELNVILEDGSRRNLSSLVWQSRFVNSLIQRISLGHRSHLVQANKALLRNPVNLLDLPKPPNTKQDTRMSSYCLVCCAYAR